MDDWKPRIGGACLFRDYLGNVHDALITDIDEEGRATLVFANCDPVAGRDVFGQPIVRLQGIQRGEGGYNYGGPEVLREGETVVGISPEEEPEEEPDKSDKPEEKKSEEPAPASTETESGFAVK